MVYYAHSKEGVHKSEWQLLRDHLTGTSEIAADFAHDAGLSDLVEIAALIHDIGKYSLAFQKRLEGSNQRVDHSTAGAQEIMSLFPNNKMALLLAYCVAGHHTGLPDYGDATDTEDQGTLLSRFKTPVEDYSAYQIEVEPSSIALPTSLIAKRPINQGFTVSFLTRMIYSALVDADFIETETFMSGVAKTRGEFDGIGTLCKRLNKWLQRFENPTSLINEKRTDLLHNCIVKSAKDPGFFTLTVPTGGGKTLASMAFALNHANLHELSRIIYVIPYTSIIEQNAAVFKNILGEDNVLEHHSNFDWERVTNGEGHSADDVTAKLRLAVENWDIPIVVTTSVQFFESLFSHKSSRSRKVHNMAKSVIIFDEAQMLPLKYLKPCLTAVDELVTNYGSTAVFCTATQPSLQRFYPRTEMSELAPDPEAMVRFFKRVEVRDRETLSDHEIIEELMGSEQALCIVNTRKHARGLFGMLTEHCPEEECFHLSTLMCPAHRKETVATIRHRLDAAQPCRVISTQVMEAGIDVDFPVGYRAMAGLDSIIQAAGRINREGSQTGKSYLHVFEPASQFINKVPAFIGQGADISRGLLGRHPDPISLDAIEDYFNMLYGMRGEKALDTHGIMPQLNSQRLEFEFREASRKFKLIDNNTQAVLVPFDKTAQQLIARLQYVDFPGSLLRRLQVYSVNIYDREFQTLESQGLIDIYVDRFPVLNDLSYYHSKTGLVFPEDVGGEGIFL